MRSKVLIIDDINMFVTSFVLLGQLEASELGTIAINDHMFSESLMALNEFRDKNSPPGIPKYIFWPQKLVNGTWSAFPINLVHVI